MAIRDDRMGQSWLLPPDISELIPVDHICYLVIAIVNGIDVSEIEEKLKKVEEELNKSGQKAVSLTDPEARFMKNKKNRTVVNARSDRSVQVKAK